MGQPTAPKGFLYLQHSFLLLEMPQTTPPSYDEVRSRSVLTSEQIQQMLPHRYPFQLVDKVVRLDEAQITAVKNVSINEPFFQGHFPSMPVMPGVLQVEALAQAGGLLALHKTPSSSRDNITYLLGIDCCRFRAVVVPGDVLILRCSLASPMRRGMVQMYGEAFVGQRLVCTSTLLAQLGDRLQKPQQASFLPPS